MKPKKRKILLDRAIQLQNEEKYLEAIEELKLQIETHGEEASSVGLIAILYISGLDDFESALPYAEKSVKYSPKSEKASFGLALCLQHFGRAEELDKEIKRFLSTGQILDLYETLFEENNLTKEDFL